MRLTKDLVNAVTLAQVLELQETYKVLDYFNEYAINLHKYYGGQLVVHADPTYYNRGICICTRINDADYDKLTTAKGAGADIEKIQLSDRIEWEVEGVVIDIIVIIQCDLPKEDLALFHLMGKVKYDSGYTSAPSAFIVCEV